MKNTSLRFLFLFCSLLFPALLQAQVKNVTVETYYISDASDSAGSLGYGDTLVSGSTTYRIFIQLGKGYKLKRIYGDADHTLRISSTSSFYNNTDRTNWNFGYQVSKSWFSGNPSHFLDSWLTIGKATSTQAGTLKAEDPDASIITASYPMLKNCDPGAGICITDSDGLTQVGAYPGSWSFDGFNGINGADSTVFGIVNSGNGFISNNAYLLQNAGVSGPLPDNNVLVAQLTTKGTITFELNVEVVDSNGNSTFCMANGMSRTSHDTTWLLTPSLKYPPDCGCKDPHFLEYSPSYSCDLKDSCKTQIIFGCMDTLACNYDPNANFNVQGLCCYPGLCNERDLSVVCPSIVEYRPMITVYPNPAGNEITLKAENFNAAPSKYVIYNSFGKEITTQSMEINSNLATKQIDISNLHPGFYMIRLYNGNDWESKNFMKN